MNVDVQAEGRHPAQPGLWCLHGGLRMPGHRVLLSPPRAWNKTPEAGGHTRNVLALSSRSRGLKTRGGCRGGSIRFPQPPGAPSVRGLWPSPSTSASTRPSVSLCPSSCSCFRVTLSPG